MFSAERGEPRFRDPRSRNALRNERMSVPRRVRAKTRDGFSYSEFCVPPFHTDAHTRAPFDIHDVYREIPFAIATRKLGRALSIARNTTRCYCRCRCYT